MSNMQKRSLLSPTIIGVHTFKKFQQGERRLSRSLMPRSWIRKRLQSAYGTTLIETLIAIVVLSIALLALSGMQVSAFYISNDSGKLTQAMVAAQDTVELLMALRYDDANLNDATPINVYTDYSMSNANLNVAPPVGIDVTWAVDDQGDDTKLINVTTRWNNRGRQKTLVLPLRVYKTEGE